MPWLTKYVLQSSLRIPEVALTVVQQVYYWTTIRKNKERYASCRGIKDEAVPAIIFKRVVLEKDPTKACEELLSNIPGLRNFLQRLRSAEEKEHFRRHIRKYVDIYMPDCPFEVSSTNRYTINDHEASVTARKDIRKGEVIKYLSGIQVAMTKEEEKTLDLTRRDFSIVMSSRKKVPSLFLGPARFANHDCNANARLSTRGTYGMAVYAVRNIIAGDEITVSYGDDYFGEDNHECLCASCESNGRNGWAPIYRGEKESKSMTSSPIDEDEEGDTPYSFRRKRRYPTDSAMQSGQNTPTKEDSRKRRRKNSLEMPATPKSLDAHQASFKRKVGRPRKRLLSPAHSSQSEPTSHDRSGSLVNMVELHHTNIDRVTDSEPSLREVRSEDSFSSRSKSPASSMVGGSQCAQSTNPSSVTDENVAEKVEVMDPLNLNQDLSLNIIETIEEVSLIPTSLDEVAAKNEDNESYISDLSDLSTRYAFDETKKEAIRLKSQLLLPARFTRSRAQCSPTNTPSLFPDFDSPENENPRRPGDWTMTSTLLTVSTMRWVHCQTCDQFFVQHEASKETRKECPRCERHSKLYGFPWPKTDREGKWDREERIMDHRTVHRFVTRKEDKDGRRSGKVLAHDLLKKRESEARSRTWSVESETPRKRRRFA